MPARVARALVDAALSYTRLAWWGILAPRTSEREPLVVVQAAICGERGVLLAERADLRGWELPGGTREPGESDERALERELREELGIEIEIERHVGDWRRSGFRPHTARVYRCRARGEPVPLGEETLAVAWFPVDALPGTLFPWYREPLALALGPPQPPVVREERQGLATIWAGARIDLTMRLRSDRPEASDAQNGDTPTG
jgi:8-oxo-dGTP pyrophosphatase MutT (NUDIX family)